MRLTLQEAFLAAAVTGILMFLLRLLPFMLFIKKEPPAFFKFAGKYIPAIAIAVLCISCLRGKTTDKIFFASSDIAGAYSPDSVAAGFIAITACILLHLWKKNSMLSIFTGTILYMILS